MSNLAEKVLHIIHRLIVLILVIGFVRTANDVREVESELAQQAQIIEQLKTKIRHIERNEQ